MGVVTRDYIRTVLGKAPLTFLGLRPLTRGSGLHSPWRLIA